MSINDASRIVIDDSRVKLQTVASLTDHSKGVIFDHNLLLVQTAVKLKSESNVFREIG